MNKKRLFDILYIILIISLIAFMIWLVIFLKSGATDCMNDPINYIKDRIGEDAYCYCMKSGKLIEFREGTGSYINKG